MERQLPARPDHVETSAPARPRILAQIVLAVNALCACVGAAAQSQAQPQDPVPAPTTSKDQTQKELQEQERQPATPLPVEAPEQRAVRYEVRIDAPRKLHELLESNLDLMRWRGNPRVDLEQLQRLVRNTPEEAKTLVATEGYYSPKISSGLDTSGATPVARVIVDPGEPVTVGDVDLELRGFVPFSKEEAPFDAAALRNRWTLPVGSQFRTADWESAKRGMLRQIAQSRFPRAQLADSIATVDPDTHRALLKVIIDSGPDVHFGALRIEGLQRYSPSIIQNLNQIHPGDQYNEAALQSLQGRLQDTGYFSTVEVSLDMSSTLQEQVSELNQGEGPKTQAPSGPVTMPILVRVTENKRKNLSVGVGFSTNTGARAQANYDDLNVFGKRMKSNILYEQLHQQARADFFWPTTSNGYSNSVGAGYDREDVRGQITRTTSIHATRAWGSPTLERSLRLEALTEQVTIDDQPATRAKALPLTFSITKRQLDSLVLPTRGYIANLQLGAAPLPILTDEPFVRAYVRGVVFKPLGPSGTLILRGEFGAVGSKDKDKVPSTFLFRAGGDQSVRGYGYQQLGIPVGSAIAPGRYLLTASTEYDWWFKPPYGAAVFVDAGNAADNFKDLKPKVGYGVGARWRSPVGPIAVDVAYGKAVHKVRLHFSLGFTF
jgi:translocation and assembly module TamA